MSDAPTSPTPDPLHHAHGIEEACYRSGPGDLNYRPTMTCMCGWTTGRCDSWEDAGRALDAHFAAIEKTLGITR
jgi:hypothetical protein